MGSSPSRPKKGSTRLPEPSGVREPVERRELKTSSMVRGSILGLAIGDALGALCEGWPSKECYVYLETLQKALLQPQTHPKDTPEQHANSTSAASLASFTENGRFPLGQVTDDTQVCRLLAQSLVSCGEWDGKHYAETLARFYGDHRMVGCGMATAQALTRLLQGKADWTTSGTGSSAGNGSAVRGSMVGLFFPTSSKEESQFAARVAVEQSKITHRDRRSITAAVIMTLAINQAMAYPVGSFVDPGVRRCFVQELMASLKFLCLNDVEGDTKSKLNEAKYLSEYLPFLETVVAYKREGEETKGEQCLPSLDMQVVEQISNLGIPSHRRDGTPGISGFAVTSVIWALYAFLCYSTSFWEAISASILAGGDTDSTACLVGALSGAHLGLCAVPPCLSELIQDQGAWREKELLDLSDQVFLFRTSRRAQQR